MDAANDTAAGELEAAILPLVRMIDAGECVSGVTKPLANGSRYVVMTLENYEGDLRQREVRGANKVIRFTPTS